MTCLKSSQTSRQRLQPPEVTLKSHGDERKDQAFTSDTKSMDIHGPVHNTGPPSHTGEAPPPLTRDDVLARHGASQRRQSVLISNPEQPVLFTLGHLSRAPDLGDPGDDTEDCHGDAEAGRTYAPHRPNRMHAHACLCSCVHRQFRRCEKDDTAGRGGASTRR